MTQRGCFVIFTYSTVKDGNHFGGPLNGIKNCSSKHQFLNFSNLMFLFNLFGTKDGTWWRGREEEGRGIKTKLMKKQKVLFLLGAGGVKKKEF